MCRCFSVLLTVFLLAWFIKKKLALRAYMRVSQGTHYSLNHTHFTACPSHCPTHSSTATVHRAPAQGGQTLWQDHAEGGHWPCLLPLPPPPCRAESLLRGRGGVSGRQGGGAVTDGATARRPRHWEALPRQAWPLSGEYPGVCQLLQETQAEQQEEESSKGAGGGAVDIQQQLCCDHPFRKFGWCQTEELQ